MTWCLLTHKSATTNKKQNEIQTRVPSWSSGCDEALKFVLSQTKVNENERYLTCRIRGAARGIGRTNRKRGIGVPAMKKSKKPTQKHKKQSKKETWNPKTFIRHRLIGSGNSASKTALRVSGKIEAGTRVRNAGCKRNKKWGEQKLQTTNILSCCSGAGCESRCDRACPACASEGECSGVRRRKKVLKRDSVHRCRVIIQNCDCHLHKNYNLEI